MEPFAWKGTSVWAPGSLSLPSCWPACGPGTQGASLSSSDGARELKAVAPASSHRDADPGRWVRPRTTVRAKAGLGRCGWQGCRAPAPAGGLLRRSAGVLVPHCLCLSVLLGPMGVVGTRGLPCASGNRWGSQCVDAGHKCWLWRRWFLLRREGCRLPSAGSQPLGKQTPPRPRPPKWSWAALLSPARHTPAVGPCAHRTPSASCSAGAHVLSVTLLAPGPGAAALLGPWGCSPPSPAPRVSALC